MTRLSDLTYGPPLGLLRGVAAAGLYPLAERIEQRAVGAKLRALRVHHRLTPAERRAVAQGALADMLAFAGSQVPYYRDLFAAISFDPERLRADPTYLEALPVLTKPTITEQGERMLSRPLAETRHYPCKTGGSTGEKVVIEYDQAANDHSSAVTAYGRARIGASLFRSTLHFAARLPDTPRERWPSRETYKCLAMNRSNIFFADLETPALEDIWQVLRRRSPYLVHAHPSTIYALAGHVRRHHLNAARRPVFAIFESSGELLETYQRAAIAETFGCRVVDRYGLAEFGVIAYEFEPGRGLEVLDSEVWAESLPLPGGVDSRRLIVTTLRNRLMPLIRYDTGDLASVALEDGVVHLTNLTGRIHDAIEINGVPYLTHHLQDVLDHRVSGILEFQFDLRQTRPILRIALAPNGSAEDISRRVENFWPGAFDLEFVGPGAMLRVGDRAKFRHVVKS